VASWIEIDRIRKDPAGFKSLARALLINSTFEKTEWEQDFLKDKVEGKKRQEFTTRQGETILDLRDKATLYTKYKGLSIPILIEKCWLNRFNLDERDQEFIGELKASGRGYVTGRQIGWFIGICKQLGEVEWHM
jgi:hypothetical protein